MRSSLVKGMRRPTLHQNAHNTTSLTPNTPMPMAVEFLTTFSFTKDNPSMLLILSKRKPKRPALQSLSRALPIFSPALYPFSISMEPSKKILRKAPETQRQFHQPFIQVSIDYSVCCDEG